MKEIYKTIPDYPNYEVSNLGHVRNKKFNRIVKSWDNGLGYHKVSLSNEKGAKHMTVHRLVANAFLPNPECKREVNHINGIKTDNRLENLEWSTRSENALHAFETGLNEGPLKQKVRCIETGQEFESMSSAAKYFGCAQGSIRTSAIKGYKVLKKYHFELITCYNNT